MKIWIRCLAVLLIGLLCQASAQTFTYYVDEVTTVSKPVLVSPGYMTILEFYEDVDQVMSGRPNLVKIAGVSGSKLFITAMVNSGTTDLVVDVAQRSHLFRLSVAAGNAPRRYVILNRPKPSATAPNVPLNNATKPTAKQTKSPASKPSTNSKPAATTNSNTTSGASASNASTPSTPAPAQTKPRASVAPPTDAVVNPAWLDFTVRHLQAGPLEGQYTAFLIVRNSGTRTVMLDGNDARVSDRDNKTQYQTLISRSTLSILEPGQISVMRVVIEGPLPQEISLSLTLFDLNSEASYVLKRGLNVEETLAGTRG
jgi:hypothetical protein